MKENKDEESSIEEMLPISYLTASFTIEYKINASMAVRSISLAHPFYDQIVTNCCGVNGKYTYETWLFRERGGDLFDTIIENSTTKTAFTVYHFK